MDFNSLGGFFGGDGADPQADARKQAMTLFGAAMLSGAGSGQNFSSILGNAVGQGQSAYSDSIDRNAKRQYMQSQIDSQRSESEYRRVQAQKMLADAQRAAMIQQARMGIFNRDPMQAALGTQAEGGGAGPTRQAQALGQQYAQNGVTPNYKDLNYLAGLGGLDSTDIALVGKQRDPQSFAPGSLVRQPDGRGGFIVPRTPEGTNASIGPGGQVAGVSMIPGVTDAVAANAAAQSGGTEAGKLPYVGPAEYARQTATESARSQFDLVDMKQPDGTTIKVPRSVLLGLQQPGGAMNLTGGIPMPGQGGGAIGPGARSGIPTDTVARNETRAVFDKQWAEKTFPSVQNDGMVARRTIQQMDAIEKLNLSTGWGTEAIAGLGNVLARFGVAPDELKQFTDATQVFRKFASDGVLLAQIAQAGPQTESDARRMMQTLPSLANTPAANELISAFIKAGAEMQVEKARFYTEAYKRYQQGRGTLQDIDSAWQQANGSLWNRPSMQAWQQRYPQARGTADIPR